MNPKKNQAPIASAEAPSASQAPVKLPTAQNEIPQPRKRPVAKKVASKADVPAIPTVRNLSSERPPCECLWNNDDSYM